MHEGVNLSIRLPPDLLAQREVAPDAVTVVELVGPVGVRLSAQATSGFDHVEDELAGGETSLTGDQRQLRAEGRHVVQLLPAERIGTDDPDAVALGGADQGQRGSRAAAGVLDYG